LVRESETSPGNYAFSIFGAEDARPSLVSHFRILTAADGKVYFDSGKPDPRTFDDIPEMVAYYQTQLKNPDVTNVGPPARLV
jgi:hypothetical protein